MKINRRFQDQHAQLGHADWVAIQKIERDICLLYHQLADYSYIMGDLYYGSVFDLPYWDYLAIEGVEPGAGAFTRDGCLVMILAMAWDQIDGSGAYVNAYIPACRKALAALTVEDERTGRLVRTVALALDAAEGASEEVMTELEELSGWVHNEYVKGYFRGMAREFDVNSYYSESSGDGT